MNYIRSCCNILKNYGRAYGKKTSIPMDRYATSRQLRKDSTSQITMRLAYDTYTPPEDGGGNLPPVVLLHAMLDSRKTWKFVAPEIAKLTGRKVYSVDARNHGESPWSDEFTFSILAEDLDAFLMQHNIPKAILVGHSMGGRTSLLLALKKPEKVEKLIVEDMHTKNFRPTQKGPILQYLKQIRNSLHSIPTDADEFETKKAVLQFMKPLLGNVHLKSDEIKFDISMCPLKKENGTFSYQANLNAVEHFMTTKNISHDVQGVYLGDALFIYGTKSFYKVDTDPDITELFPRAIKLPIEGASHFIHFEDPERYLDIIANFIHGNNNVTQK